MPEFDINYLKKTWQQENVSSKYNSSEILQMLNKKSRNYVKYILWISIAEFLLFLGITVYYIFNGNEGKSFINILSKLGIHRTYKLENDFNNIYFVMKIISLFVTAFFVFKFYKNYHNINVEENLKKFIIQIIKFKKTVNLFIFINILLLIFFTLILTGFVISTLHEQNIHLNNPTLTGFIVGLAVSMVMCIALIWFYYRIVYGIIMKRLSKNLEQLRVIENENKE